MPEPSLLRFARVETVASMLLAGSIQPAADQHKADAGSCLRRVSHMTAQRLNSKSQACCTQPAFADAAHTQVGLSEKCLASS